MHTVSEKAEVKISLLRRFISEITRLFALASMSIPFLIMLLLCTEVVMRYYFHHSIFFAEEVSNYGMLYMTFLGTAWLLAREKHTTLEILLKYFNMRNQWLINSITSILCSIGCFVVVWYSSRAVWQQMQIGTVMPGILGAPKAPIMAVIPVGFFLLFLQFVVRTSGYFREMKSCRKNSPNSES